MVKSLRMFGLVVTLLLSLVSFGTASAQSEPTCELVPNTNGTANPGYVRTGESTVLIGTGFTPGEAVSFWFTSPRGNVIGTPSPIEGGVAPDGTVGVRLTVTPGFASEGPGRYAITFQGASSGRTAVIYFCVNSVPPAQPTAVPPTAVPTSTTAPTATTAAATATTQPTIAPTTAVTSTVQATTPTVEPTIAPPTAAPPTIAPPTVAPPTIAPPIEIPPTVAPPPIPTSVVVGMSRTGQPDGGNMALIITVALVGMGLLSLGLLARRPSKTER